MENAVTPIIMLLVLFVFLFKAVLIIKEQSSVVVERFGKFIKIADSGLKLYYSLY